jgi:hypothetical protein
MYVSNTIEENGQRCLPPWPALPYCFLFASFAIFIAAWPQICCIIFIKRIEQPFYPSTKHNIFYIT